MSWTPINTKPGDLIVFNDYTPHRSFNNYSNKRRRMLFLTFNNKKNGNILYVSGETITIDLDKKLVLDGYNVDRIINYSY